MIDVKLKLHRKPRSRSPVPLYSIVRNEMYFLPHLLPHYRALGIEEFWFLDDRSSDGTFEFLMAQPDCYVITSNASFGDRVGLRQRRFGTESKTMVPRNLFMERWALLVDADEFLVLPPGFSTVKQVTDALDGAGQEIARALMLDFFPASLAALARAPADQAPFEACPFFDAYESVDWPSGAVDPDRAYLAGGVRGRMLAQLKSLPIDLGTALDDHELASMHKVPLHKWGPASVMASSHRAHIAATDSIQLVLAHFKFYPGFEKRIADALASKAYWLNSSEYRFLDIATRELVDWPLQGPRSRRFESAQDLVDAGLLYSRLAPPDGGAAAPTAVPARPS